MRVVSGRLCDVMGNISTLEFTRIAPSVCAFDLRGRLRFDVDQVRSKKDEMGILLGERVSDLDRILTRFRCINSNCYNRLCGSTEMAATLNLRRRTINFGNCWTSKSAVRLTKYVLANTFTFPSSHLTVPLRQKLMFMRRCAIPQTPRSKKV
jgi:hypothetical protein